MDDDYRRGRPSLHKEFDEAMGILAGDVLLNGALNRLAPPHNKIRINGWQRRSSPVRPVPTDAERPDYGLVRSRGRFSAFVAFIRKENRN